MNNIEYGIYNLDKEFLTRAKKINSNVVTDALYVGPVAETTTKNGPTSLFAPIVTDGNDDNAELFIAQGIRFGISFQAMIPVASEKLLTKADVSDEKREYYNRRMNEIKKLAEHECESHR